MFKAWAGGPKGISVILEFLNQIDKFRFKYGFFLSSSLNENNVFIMRYNSKFKIKEIARTKIEGEELICFQITRK
jgi:hypothetical protein